MGDVPPSSSAGEYASYEKSGGGFQGIVPNEGQPLYPQGPSPVNTSVYQQHYPQTYMPMPTSFTNQFDMTHAQASGRQGSFTMTAMGNALPQHMYRPGYGSGQHQQRHGTGAMAHGVVQPMAQYGPAAQHYYMPQHQQMPPYYNAHLSAQQQSQPQQASLRQNEYYQNQVMMNQPHGPLPAGYYYPPAQPYPNQHHSMQGHMTPSQFFIPDGAAGDVQKQSPKTGVGPSGYGQAESMYYVRFRWHLDAFR